MLVYMLAITTYIEDFLDQTIFLNIENIFIQLFS